MGHALGDPEFVEAPKKPIDVGISDIVKKEKSKGSPLKGFLDRKKPKEYSVKIEKSETVNCPDCGQAIFGGSSGFSGCICFGEDQHRKIWMKKSDDGLKIKFSRGWDPENIELLLETLRGKNGKH